MKLYGKLVSPSELTNIECNRMYSLMSRYFNGVSQQIFNRDLNEKQWVIILYDHASNIIQGFSTLQLINTIVQNLPIRALFSGDTIIAREYWGEAELPRIWGAHILQLIEDEPTIPLYWFLISKGYRTYRYLPVYFYDFYPRYDRVTPVFEQTLIANLSEKKFPGCYDPTTGIIRPQYMDCLHNDFASIEEGKLNDPHVRFFLETNPNYRQGDELACITLLSIENLKPLAKRIFARYKKINTEVFV